MKELVEDDDNDDGDPSNQYKARSEELNETKESNNEADVGVFNEDRVFIIVICIWKVCLFGNILIFKINITTKK